MSKPPLTDCRVRTPGRRLSAAVTAAACLGSTVSATKAWISAGLSASGELHRIAGDDARTAPAWRGGSAPWCATGPAPGPARRPACGRFRAGAPAGARSWSSMVISTMLLVRYAQIYACTFAETPVESDQARRDLRLGHDWRIAHAQGGGRRSRQDRLHRVDLLHQSGGYEARGHRPVGRGPGAACRPGPGPRPSTWPSTTRDAGRRAWPAVSRWSTARPTT